MPWSKAFEKPAAAAAAMRSFWDHGYEGTSIADVSHVAGASRYGLYDEFGDKRGLYLAALDSYRDEFVTGLLGGLTEPGAGLAELHAYLDRVADAAESPEGRRGCFMSIAAVTRAAQDADVAERVRANFDRIRDVIARALRTARDRGEWDRNLAPEVVADVLLGQIQGAAVMLRGGVPAARILAQLKLARSALM